MHAVERDGRGNADAGARRADLVDYSLRDVEREAPATFDRTAEVVLAPIRTVANELIEQVAVGGVDLHAVEAGVDSVTGGSGKVFGDAGQLVGLEGSRRHERLLASWCSGLARNRNGRRRDRPGAAVRG